MRRRWWIDIYSRGRSGSGYFDILRFLMTHQFQPDVGQRTSLVFMLTEVPAPATTVDIYQELVHALTVVGTSSHAAMMAFATLLEWFAALCWPKRRRFTITMPTHKFGDVADFVIANVEVFNRSRCEHHSRLQLELPHLTGLLRYRYLFDVVTFFFQAANDFYFKTHRIYVISNVF